MLWGSILAALLLGATPSLDRGIAKYEALEFEAAVVALTKAETEAVSIADRAKVQLYLGLCHAELAQWAKAESAFRNALVLEPSVQLPSKSSPKIEKLFGGLHAQFTAARSSQPEAPSGPRTISDKPPLPPQGPELQADTEAPSLLRPGLLAGGGALAAGGGLVLGLLSRASADTARGEPVQTLAAGHADNSRSQAIAADVFFAAATTLAVAAVVDYLLPSGKEEK